MLDEILLFVFLLVTIPIQRQDSEIEFKAKKNVFDLCSDICLLYFIIRLLEGCKVLQDPEKMAI